MGETVLLTRPEAEAGAFAATLPDTVEVLIDPLTEIVPVGEALVPGDAGALIFTSRNAVARVRDGGARGRRAYCVGHATAEAAAAAGFKAVESDGDAERLVALILSEPDRGPYLHPRGAETAFDVIGALRKAGREASDRVVYKARARALSDATVERLSAGSVDVIAVFSRRAAIRLVEEGARDWNLSSTDIVSISRAAAEPLMKIRTNAVNIAEMPTARSVRAEILAALQRRGGSAAWQPAAHHLP
ncbi:MAG: uroporphyrinogen-III synthase [Rubricella sp.]